MPSAVSSASIAAAADVSYAGGTRFDYFVRDTGESVAPIKPTRGRARHNRRRIRGDNDTANTASSSHTASWRVPSRLRTVAGCLIVCLNIPVEPPDQPKPAGSNRCHCWIDTSSQPPSAALKAIGARLQSAYTVWHEKCRYRLCLDPTSDDIRKQIQSTRRMFPAQDDRILIHYNGHGVPKPTSNGEVWVYNQSYTQYIPVSIYDVQAWLDSSCASLWVIDCSAAAHVVDAFHHFRKQRKDKRDKSERRTDDANTQTLTSANVDDDDCRHILLAACAVNESVPSTADMPADLFTSCLLTPIKTALRFASSKSHHLLHSITADMIDSLPGMKKPNHRKSPFGELNWIFTAVTDSIAWSVLPTPMFQRLFRQDPLVASLYRNYLLAQRILHSYNVTTVCSPKLPLTHQHPMWSVWDLCADHCLSMLIRFHQQQTPFAPSNFFADQLTAFEIYLTFAHSSKPNCMQLPVVLQVLLSTDHRLRALVLLCRFLDKGEWAVNAALSVGIFPYVLRLLQSPDLELKPLLTFIWSKVISADKATAADLIRPEYISYFTAHLNSAAAHDEETANVQIPTGLGGGGEVNALTVEAFTLLSRSHLQSVLSSFILSAVAESSSKGAHLIVSNPNLNLAAAVHSAVLSRSALLRRWICLLISRLCIGHHPMKAICLVAHIHEPISSLLNDSASEVRAAALLALSQLIGYKSATSADGLISDRERVEIEFHIGYLIHFRVNDASPLVRCEMISALAEVIYHHRDMFVLIAASTAAATVTHAHRGDDNAVRAIYIWRSILRCCRDPYPPVSQCALEVRKWLKARAILQNQLGAQRYDRINQQTQQNNAATTNDAQTVRAPSNATPSEPEVVPAPPPPLQLPQRPAVARHFDRFQMSNMREHKLIVNANTMQNTTLNAQTAPINSNGSNSNSATSTTVSSATPSASSVTASSSSSSSSVTVLPIPLTSSSSTVSDIDERATDPTWTVPSSRLYSLSVDYVGRSLLVSSSDAAIPSLDALRRRHIRDERNDRLQRRAREWADDVRIGSGYVEIAFFDTDWESTAAVAFHPFEHRLYAADGKTSIGVWAYGGSGVADTTDSHDRGRDDDEDDSDGEGERDDLRGSVNGHSNRIGGGGGSGGGASQSRLNSFSNDNHGARISAMLLINEMSVDPLLMTASDDGVVRVWRDAHIDSAQTLLTAWNAAPPGDQSVTAASAGAISSIGGTSTAPFVSASRRRALRPAAVVDWQQNSGRLIAAANGASVLCVWDVNTLQCVRDIDTSSYPTCAVTPDVGPIAFVGCRDGAVRIIDTRTPSNAATVVHQYGGGDAVISVALQTHHLITANVNSEFAIIDTRTTSTFNTFQRAAHRDGATKLTAAAVHPFAPLCATGSHKPLLEIFDLTSLNTVETIKYHIGFLGQRIGGINALSFHRHRQLLAVGCNDAFISIFAGEKI